MYKYKTLIDINEQDEYSDDFVFGIKLQSGTRFKLINCYVEFKRGNEGRYSERLYIEYYSNEYNKKKAEKEINKCVNCLTFLFGIPLGLNRYIDEKKVEENISYNNVKSNKKVAKIKAINDKILRFNRVKDLFYYNIKMYSVAINHNFTYGYNEHSYLDFFKIVENIANHEFGINKDTITFENSRIKSILEELFKTEFKVEFTEDKITDITGKTIKNLLQISTDNVYFKIYWLLSKYNLNIEPQILSKMIDIRNCIAHGEDIEESEFKKCYEKVYSLAAQVISKKFFNKKHSEIRIESYFNTR